MIININDYIWLYANIFYDDIFGRSHEQFILHDIKAMKKLKKKKKEKRARKKL